VSFPHEPSALDADSHLSGTQDAGAEGAKAGDDGVDDPDIALGRHRSPGRARSGILGLLRETAIIIGCALVVSWLIKTFLVQAFYIPSESMRDTLEVGDRVMVSRMVPRVFDVHRGDIVVFLDPGDWLEPHEQPDRGPLGNAATTALTMVGLLPADTGEHLIKRTIGVPGDHVTCCDADGLIEVNGVALHEPYIRPGSVPSQVPFDEVVPEGMLFVMGDNRQNSADSRFNTTKPYGGFVPISNVVGTAFATVWPFGHLEIHRNPGSVFAVVPEPTSTPSPTMEPASTN
jgi:signal peptidase I